jgi:hypothetical protein
LPEQEKSEDDVVQTLGTTALGILLKITAPAFAADQAAQSADG